MNQETPKNYHQNQQGFVLIIVVSILTVILALISIGFSRLSSREVIQASHRESASQAYYAAQSGINDAIAYIEGGGPDFTGCTNWPTPLGDEYFTKDLSNGSNTAKYSCISVSSTPQYLQATVTPGQPWVVKVDANNLEELYIGWENHKYISSTPVFFKPPTKFGSLPDYANLQSDQTGVLRAQIYGVPRDASCNNNSCLEGGSRVYYLYPDSGNGRIKCKKHGTASDPKKGCVLYDDGFYNAAGNPQGLNGVFVSGDCDTSRPDPSGNNLGVGRYCNSEISGLDGSQTGNFYYLYFTAQYQPIDVVIQGVDSSNNATQFTGAQAKIDVTGQSAGQIQRVRATVDLTTQYSEPNYAVQSMESLCKVFNMQITGLGAYTPSAGAGPSIDSRGCVAPSTGGSIIGAPDTAGH